MNTIRRTYTTVTLFTNFTNTKAFPITGIKYLEIISLNTGTV